MTKNRITALLFDDTTFPFSPHYKEFDIREELNRIVVTGYDKKPKQDDDFMVEFARREEAYAPLLPDGEYHILARMLSPIDQVPKNKADQFKIEFSFYNTATNKIEAAATIDAKDYLESYAAYFNAAGRPDPNKPEMQNRAEELEKQYSLNYMKKAFGQLIQGNDAFWTQFYGSIDIATAPVNMEISLARDGVAPKPIVVKEDLRLG